ncbi:sulfatase-like hydrolase/transferase, partial [Persicitalea sp.]|uniref:sulfatase-like hydrolase/transferase n=1 Tax=Persicitalea sp. TaxID=3100273 RepID=UPI0035942002
MNSRLFSICILTLGVLAWGVVYSQSRPNVVLILADDMGYGDLGCYGGTTIPTPHIDALARGGMRFTDFHSNGVVCSPTRAALLTGRYQQRAGVPEVITVDPKYDELGLPLSETTLAEVVKKAGYDTAIFGKWHLGYQKRYNPTYQGFDAFRGYVSGNVDYQSHLDAPGRADWWSGAHLEDEPGYVTDLVTKHGVEFIERHRDRPFLLYLAHESPHYPYQGPDDPAFRKPNGKNQSQGPRQDVETAYREMIVSLDEGVGRVVAALKKAGLEKSTLIIFCSDNGPTGPGLAGPLRGRKGTTWEGGHRVPGIFYWPGRIAAGLVTDETALTMDILPTVAA